MWMRGGPGDGAFDVVEKLFDDRVVRGDDESLELDPIASAAFEVECVPKQHSSMAGYRFEDMPAVNDVPVHAVEGELSEPSRKICGACVSDPPMPPAGAVGQQSIQNHWAPVGSRPHSVLRRSEGREQRLDSVECYSWE